jgi:hypothetical protein
MIEEGKGERNQRTEDGDDETRDVDRGELVVEDEHGEKDYGDFFEDACDGSGRTTGVSMSEWRRRALSLSLQCYDRCSLDEPGKERTSQRGFRDLPKK